MHFTSSKRRISASIALVAYSLTIPASIYGQGVTVGSSSLFDTVDYGDTFTGTDDGGNPDRPYVPAIQPPAAYIVEQTFGKPSVSFSGASFSFASDQQPAAPGFVAGANAYPTGITNASGAGSNTGFTQTGGAVDYGLPYSGIRDEYWVQVDAVQNPDRVDISSGAGVGIFAPDSLSVFFRGDGSGNASLFNGATDTPIQSIIPGFDTGITGSGAWHNYAVRYDMPDNEIEIYVDEVSKGTINLGTFAGGIYSGFSNAFVGAGGAGGDRTWTDNFQVGGIGPSAPVPVPHPDPGNLPGLPSSLVSFWDFNEAAGPVAGRTLNFAYDRQGNKDGTFLGTVERTAGIVGLGAAQFNDLNGDAISVGTDFNLSGMGGITVEAIITTDWDGNDQAEFFRKEDGNDRILFSFQAGGNIGGPQLVGTAGTPGISLGLNTGGYGELDVAFDGIGDRPTLAEVADGNPHHFVATYNPVTGVKEIWMDGVLIGFFDVGDNVALTTGGAADARIGASGGGEPFDGKIDELAIYNAALTPAEIAEHLANVNGGAPNYFDIIPEPGSATLLLLCILGLGMRRRRG